MLNHSRRNSIIGLSTAAATLVISGPALSQDNEFIGTWSGKLAVGSSSLRLRLVIKDAKSAILFSLDQGNSAIPSSLVSGDGNNIKIEFAVIGAVYEAKLSDKDHLKGIFTQGGHPLDLNLLRGEIIEPKEEPIQPLSQKYLQDSRAKSPAPAMMATYQLAKNKPIIYSDGLRSAQDKIRALSNDKWHIGSLTKSMTSTLIAILVERGILSWQTTVEEILGSTVKNIQPNYKNATMLHLLSHRAGLQANIEMTDLNLFSRKPLKDPIPERLKYASLALSQMPIAGLAEKMHYSNNGYIIAGAMLEKITNTSWENLIKTHLFAALGLHSAGFGAPGVLGKLDQPLGHLLQNSLPFGADLQPNTINDNPAVLSPAGRVHMSALDLITYLIAHKDTPANLLSAESWQTLHTPPFGGDYALGWVVRPDKSLWHNGSNTLWYAEATFNKSLDFVAVAAANEASPDSQNAVAKLLKAAQLAVTA